MKSIGTRMILVASIICLVGMLVVGSVCLVVGGHSIQKHSVDALEMSTKSKAEEINGWLSNQIKFIDAFSVDMAYLTDPSKESLMDLFRTQAAVQECYDVYVGFPDGSGVFGSGYDPAPEDQWIAYERPWYVAAMQDTSRAYVTPPYTDTETGSLCITISKAVFKNNEVFCVTAADILINDLTDVVRDATPAEGGYAFLTDAEGHILVHPNESYAPDADDNFPLLSDVSDGSLASIQANADSVVQAVIGLDYDGVEKYFTAQPIGSTGWFLYGVVPTATVNAPVSSLIYTIFPILIGVLLLSILSIFLFIRKSISRPIQQITAVAAEIAEGNTNVAFSGSYIGEIRQLADSFNAIAAAADAQARATKQLADGDLTADIPVRSGQDTMGQALSQLVERFRDIIGNLHNSSKQVALGSGQISESSQALAQGSTEQAAAIEKLSATVSDVSERTKQNAQMAAEAQSVSQGISVSAQKGKSQLESMVSAVSAISEASQGISKVIKTIDDIAFQTNILALNAAVEAARAGQHGKGFAVVAEEVRTLAGKSAQAANETTTLIENSMLKAEDGVRIARETNTFLGDIIQGIDQTAQLVGEISQFTSEQTAAITQIDDGISQIGSVVQSNAGTAEQTASAAQDLSQEADSLNRIVTMFQIGHEPRKSLGARSDYAVSDLEDVAHY